LESWPVPASKLIADVSNRSTTRGDTGVRFVICVTFGAALPALAFDG
jgi:hypothetical protein